MVCVMGTRGEGGGVTWEKRGHFFFFQTSETGWV